ncbi:MAG: TonB-dependent receptor [Bacteroidia bacterium]|nr:TonB-dependent receptor [Bacteroidia bacterium]
MVFRIAILNLVLFFPLFLFGQSTVIKGKVTDASNHETLIGVNVLITSSNGTATDVDGNYSLEVKEGKLTVTFSYIGYTAESRLISIKAGETKRLDVDMHPSTVMLDAVVVSAGKFEQKLGDVTVSMDVIKPSMIENNNATNMSTVIEKVPGVTVTDGQASIRGGSGYSYGAGSRVMVLVDDLPILSSDVGDAKWDYIPLENIEQVEILKGASSALYGSSALNGVINIRTAFPRQEPHSTIEVFSGMYMDPKRESLKWWGNTLRLFNGTTFSHSRKIGNFDLVTGINIYDDEGYRTQNYEKHTRFDLAVRYRDPNIKGLYYGFGSNGMYIDKSDFFLWLSADSAYKQNTSSVNPTTGYRFNIDPYVVYQQSDSIRHSLKTRFYRVTNNIAGANKDNRSDSYFADYQFQRKFRNDLVWINGVTADYGNVVAELYGNHKSSGEAVFSQVDKKFLGQISFSLGLRWEFYRLDHETKDSRPLFRTGVNYQLADNTYLRASYGQGYRFPTIAEKYTETTVSSLRIFPNPDLKPETGWSSEIGIKQGVKISNWNGYLDVAAFWTEYHDMMEFTFGVYNPDSIPPSIDWMGFKSVNVGNARITGIDVTFTGQGSVWGLPATILAGYTYTDPINLNDTLHTSTSKVLKYRFYHSFKADAEIDRKILSAGISMEYNSNMVNIDREFEDGIAGIQIFPGLKEYRQTHNKGYTVFDFRFGVQATTNSKLSLIIKNLFNNEYMVRPGDIRPPRNITFQYQLKL